MTTDTYPIITQENFSQSIPRLRQAMAALPAGRLALDLETTGLDAWSDKIISIAFGSPGNVVVIDTRAYYSSTPAQQERWRHLLCSLFCVPTVTWTGHNLKFDGVFLAVHFGVQLAYVYDTMLAEQLLYAGRVKVATSLLETAKRYQIAVSKEERSWFIDLDLRKDLWDAPFPQGQITYILQDIEVPYRIAHLQQAALQKHQLLEVLALENAALPALVAMEVRGAFIDQEQWKKVLDLKRSRQAHLEETLHATLAPAYVSVLQAAYLRQVKAREEHQQAHERESKRLMQDYLYGEARKSKTWDTFYKEGMQVWGEKHPEIPKPKVPELRLNMGSSDQLLVALHAVGIEVDSTREEELGEHIGASPLIRTLLEWKKLNHFCSAFGENILSHIKSDGRIHAHFAQIGAVSGRIICRDPNLQQIPKAPPRSEEEEDIRRCFIAGPGNLLLKADLSNIELRIIAEVSGDATMLRFFAEGKDLHAETAKLMFKLPADTNTKKHLYRGLPVRDIAKTINFGLAYGMGAQGLANRTGVEIHEAKGLIRTYFSTYTGVDRYLRQAGRHALEQGYAETLVGRKRFFSSGSKTSSFLQGSMERTAKNHPIQGTNADILKQALSLLYEQLPAQVQIILVVHDEIVLESPVALCDEAERILKACMHQACRTYLKQVHIPEPDVIRETYWKKDD